MTSNTNKRTYHSRAWWQEQIDACERSGLSQAKYCEQHQINPSSLSNWYSKLRKGTAKSSNSRSQKTKSFIQVTPDHESTIPAHTPHVIEITHRDVSVRIDNITTPEMLVPWLNTVRSSV